MRKIWVIPFGGLGNRMRVMNSAMAMNRQLNSEIRLVWLVKAELNIALSRLFKDTGFDYIPVVSLAYAFFLRFYKHIFILKYESFYRAFSSLFFDTVIFDSDVLRLEPEALLARISAGKKVLIATCYAYYPFENFDNYELNPDLKQKVENLSDGFDDATAGVHIRRTDHTLIMKESPVEKYLEAMDKLLVSAPATRFFLATDDAEVKEEISRRYTGKIITQETPLSRSSEEGMLGAVVDIYCLSKVNKIICNTGSSFAKTAALIGKTKEIIEIR